MMLCLSAGAQAERIWLEAENTSSRNYEGPFEFPGVVSGDKILRLWRDDDPQADSYVASWQFHTTRSGKYHIWAAISQPGNTSRVWWRVDNAKYQHFTEDTDCEPSSLFGVSNTLAWTRFGTCELSAGEHTVSLMVNERRNNSEHAYLSYADALLITDEDITPNGLVTAADVPKLVKIEQEKVTPVHRAGKAGKPMAMGTSIMIYQKMRLAKSVGFTMFQTDSDHLASNQLKPGEWDWNAPDSELQRCQQLGVTWQYFPHLHWANDWQKSTDRYVPSICTTHGWKIGAMSVWSPWLSQFFDEGYDAMAKHYGSGKNKMGAIYLGIHGDFGESIYPMGFHPSEIERFGAEGSGHGDWWCGDQYAKASFRQMAEQKYHTIAELNKAWGSSYSSFRQVTYPLSGEPLVTSADRHRWLDFINWYAGSMTKLTDDVTRIARTHFPKSLLQLPIGGGDANLMYGMEHTKYAKLAKQYNTHIRSTHGGYMPVAQNYATMIRLLASSCKFYKVPFWTEPPGGQSADSEVGRIFESISSGAYGFWDWGANPTSSPNVFRKYKEFLTQEKPVTDVAIFWPSTNLKLHPLEPMPAKEAEAAAALRDVIDYDVIDEDMINDGALKGHRVLVLLEGQFIDATALQSIANWVKSGGVVVSYNYGAVTDVEGQSSVWRELFGITEKSHTIAATDVRAASAFLKYASKTLPNSVMTALSPDSISLAGGAEGAAIWAHKLGKGYGIYSTSNWDARKEFYELVRDTVYNLKALDKRMPQAIEADKAWDGVYCTLLPSNEVIAYNSNHTPANIQIGNKSVNMEPLSITSVMFK